MAAIEAMPDPIMRASDVLIEVHAASVNPVDFKFRQGKLKLFRKLNFPTILGCDVADVVRQVGPQVTKFKPGDMVFATLEKERLGGFAELAAADESVVARMPSSLDYQSAAALPLVFLTSWQGLVEHAKVKSDLRVLIHAGAGGVGTIAIQVAKYLGLHVATTTSAKTIDFVKSLGADTVIDYNPEDFSQVLSDYDVVLDTMGGDIAMRSFDVLKHGGTMLSIAGPPDVAWARNEGVNPMLAAALGLVTIARSWRARKSNIHFVFYFMRPDGEQLAMRRFQFVRRVNHPYR
jgi:NADPH:quinone reductase-like Zn-dependent oxidoreductase